jgi:hypothetical protein
LGRRYLQIRDGGRTWNNMGLLESGHIARIVTHPTNPDIVYVAVPGKLLGTKRRAWIV